MDSASEHSEKKAPLGTTFNEQDLDVAAFASVSEAPLDPEVAARLRCVLKFKGCSESCLMPKF